MSKYKTEDGVEVTATFYDEDDALPQVALDHEVSAPVWVMEYPDEVRFCHPNAFDGNYTLIGD